MHAKPYDLYIKFLYTRGIQQLDDVNRCLEELSLLKINEAELVRACESIESRVPKPVQDQMSKQKNLDGQFYKWMHLLEVKPIWDFKQGKNKDFQLVFDVHNDPRLRLCLHALLIKNQTNRDIIQDLNVKFSYMLREEHIAWYRRVFWNPAKMTRAAWRQYLERCENDERALIFIALTEPLDVVKTHLEMPARPKISDAMQFLFVNSYQKAKQYLRMSTPDSNKEARNWINTTMQLADKYEKHSSGDQADFGKALQMEFEYVDTEFDTPDEAVLKEIRAKDKAALEAEEEEEGV